MQCNAQRTGLLIVDIQNDFCPGGMLPVDHGDRVVAPANRLMKRFDHVVLTQDWHPAGHTSFATSHPGASAYDVVDCSGIDQTLWPDHCVSGSPGAAFHPGLETNLACLVLRKGMHSRIDSYSAFFENDRITATGLHGWLIARAIDTVVIAGLATDFCVKYSALDAVRLGFHTIVVEDAVRGVDVPSGNVASALRELRASGVLFATSGSLEVEA